MTSKPLYQKIFADYVARIESGTLKPGDQLPTEMQISEAYGVSRITSKRAMEELRNRGLIERTPGRGSFVSNGITTEHARAAINQRKTDGNKMIGLIIPDFSDSYGTEIVTGIEEACRTNGLTLILRRSLFLKEEEDQAITELLEAGCSGLIIMPQHNDYFNERILRLILDGYPVVIIDREMRGIDSCYIATDNYRAAFDATHRLLTLGHKDIIFLSFPIENASSLQERMAGFRHAFYRHHILWNEDLLFTKITSNEDSGTFEERMERDIERVQKFIQMHPDSTALFATEYHFAQIALLALQRLGISVPDEYSVIGYDGPSSMSGNAFMTRIIQPQSDMGKEAVNALLKQIQGLPYKKNIKLESSMFEGKSIAAVHHRQ